MLLTWTFLIGQFVYPVRGERWGKGGGWGDRYFSQLQVLL